jgi:hypothetical protein
MVMFRCEDEDKERANVSMNMNIIFTTFIVKKKRKEKGRRTYTPRITPTTTDSKNGWCKRGWTSLGLKNSSS